MWNNAKSVTLSIIVTRALMGIIFLLIFFLPLLGKWYLHLRNIGDFFLFDFVFPLYLCIPPALAALFFLDRILARVRRGEVFVMQNIHAIRWISWCCFAVGLITGVSAFWYPPYIFVMMIMFFCGLLVRVIKNVFAQAVVLKDENDYTI